VYSEGKEMQETKLKAVELLKCSTAAFAVCLASLVTGSARGEMALYEPFNYNAGAIATYQATGTNTNDGTGTAWNFNRTATSTATNGTQIVAGDIPYPEYTGITGTADNHKARPTGATYSGNGYDALALNRTYTNRVYYSLTLNVSNITGQNFARGANGSFLAGLYNDSPPPTVDANIGAGLDIKSPDNTATASTATRYILGIQAANVAATSRAFDANTTFVQGDTVFVVVEYIFNGSGADTVNLYLNPAASTLGPSGSGAPGTPNATSTGDFTGNQNIQSFVLRSNSSLPSAVNVDNLIVGDTWVSVTAVPEPGSSAALALAAGSLLARRRRCRSC
jgi:hypothetical protein